MIDNIHAEIWDVFIQTYPDSTGGLAKPLLELGLV